MTDRAMNGINATLPVARGGQAPTPPRGAPKAQGLRASRNRNTLRRAVKRNYIAIAQISLRQPPLAHSVGREIPTTLTDVTGIRVILCCCGNSSQTLSAQAQTDVPDNQGSARLSPLPRPGLPRLPQMLRHPPFCPMPLQTHRRKDRPSCPPTLPRRQPSPRPAEAPALPTGRGKVRLIGSQLRQQGIARQRCLFDNLLDRRERVYFSVYFLRRVVPSGTSPPQLFYQPERLFRIPYGLGESLQEPDGLLPVNFPFRREGERSHRYIDDAGGHWELPRDFGRHWNICGYNPAQFDGNLVAATPERPGAVTLDRFPTIPPADTPMSPTTDPPPTCLTGSGSGRTKVGMKVGVITPVSLISSSAGPIIPVSRRIIQLASLAGPSISSTIAPLMRSILVWGAVGY